MSKDKARIGHVNSDHLWYGFDDGKSAALKDHKESGTNDSTIVAVVRLSDYAALEAKLAECVAALTRVINVADRNTNEFNFAREVLSKVKK